jgi:hypothetical protein
MPNPTVKSAIAGAVLSAVTAVAADSTTQLQPSDARAVSQQIKAEIAADPVVQHVTNTEPWYQSRVTIGAIVSIAVPLLGLIGISTDVIDADMLTRILTAGGVVIGGALTLYGRWVARKPIGQ